MAIADVLLLISSGIPYIVHHHLNYTRALSLPVVWRALYNLFYICAIETITLVSLERFLAICFPIRHRLIKGSKRTNRVIAISWLFALFVGVISFILCEHFTSTCAVLIYWPDDNQYSDYPSQIEISWFNPQFELILDSSICGFNFILLLFNGFMYIKIYLAVNNTERANLNSSADLESQLRQVSLMLIVNGSAFFICYSIQTLAFIWITLIVVEQISAITSVVLILGQLSHIFFLINSSFNPLLYFITNRRYRKAFKTAFTWRKQIPQQRNNVNNIELSNTNKL